MSTDEKLYITSIPIEDRKTFIQEIAEKEADARISYYTDLMEKQREADIIRIEEEEGKITAEQARDQLTESYNMHEKNLDEYTEIQKAGIKARVIELQKRFGKKDDDTLHRVSFFISQDIKNAKRRGVEYQTNRGDVIARGVRPSSRKLRRRKSTKKGSKGRKSRKTIKRRKYRTSRK